MKELIFIRHAKSDWNNPLLSDINRPLGPRGLKDAPIMAARLRSLVPAVDHIVSSNAVRALETFCLGQCAQQQGHRASVTIK
ncbi:MAG TPA: histidine phosphatase family protein, partial [Saprospiraceae bacterium]|nr:histidine phosphatase family protein [Saprospiraceae bacterium]